MTVEQGIVARVSIGAGGVAATPARAVRTEALLRHQPWSADAAMLAAATLREEFQPISDMRASAGYRSEVLGNLMQRYWLESQGMAHINLEAPSVSAMAGADPASTAASERGPWIAGQARNDNPEGWMAGRARNDDPGSPA